MTKCDLQGAQLLFGLLARLARNSAQVILTLYTTLTNSRKREEGRWTTTLARDKDIYMQALFWAFTRCWSQNKTPEEDISAKNLTSEKDCHFLGCSDESNMSVLSLCHSSLPCFLQQVGQVKTGLFCLSQRSRFKATNQLFYRKRRPYLANCERLSADNPGEAEGEVTKHTWLLCSLVTHVSNSCLQSLDPCSTSRKISATCNLHFLLQNEAKAWERRMFHSVAGTDCCGDHPTCLDPPMGTDCPSRTGWLWIVLHKNLPWT